MTEVKPLNDESPNQQGPDDVKIKVVLEKTNPNGDVEEEQEVIVMVKGTKLLEIE